MTKPAYHVGIAGYVIKDPIIPTKRQIKIEADNFKVLLIQFTIAYRYNDEQDMLMRDNSKLTKKNIFIGIALFLVFAAGFAVTYFSFKFSKIFEKHEVSSAPSNVYINVSPEPVDSKEGVFNVLLLGYGGSGHSGGGLTDSIIVLHIDTNSKKYTLISIPRDLWINGNRKINAEASVNGYPSTSAAVKSVTGLPVDNYVAVNFSNYSKMIDNLGGVDVQVPTAFTDSFYPVPGLENETCGFTGDEINGFKAKYSGFELEKQFTCRYETISYKVGPATLDGTAALKFVRSRHADSDFARSARQFAVLAGVKNKLLSLKSLNKLDSTIGTLSEMVKTDLTLGKIKTLIEIFGDTSAYTGTEIRLTTENLLNEGKSAEGAYILYPKAGNLNFAEIKNFISQNI